jgi:hypothetical protein
MKFVKIFLQQSLLWASLAASASEVSQGKSFQLKSGTVEYLAEHKMHNTVGISKEARG